ncbi:MAG TPA: response regulator [Flavisolibacter sp.]|nr:response regulator [Flavisolibacter sp.]
MKKILVVEDNLDIRDNTAEILEMANYRVYTAENGLKGVESAIANKPDLIICDIMMPELDGYGVLHVIQHNPELKSIPFIFLSAKTEPSEVRKGMGLGADDYIPKPFTATDLLNAIESRLKKVEVLKSTISSDIHGYNHLLSITSGKEALQQFIDGRNTNRYKKKQIIFSEGNRPTRLYYIQKGKVKIIKSNDEGKELVVNLFNEGDFFGYTALLEGNSYKASAVAIEECEIAEIPKEEFEELMNTNPEVTHKFIQLLAKNITEKEKQLLNLAYNSLRKKVADALITLMEKYGRKFQDHYTIDISRENLATIAGTATESLIRTLSDFKNEKLLEILEGHIIILNENKLRKMIN